MFKIPKFLRRYVLKLTATEFPFALSITSDKELYEEPK